MERQVSLHKVKTFFLRKVLRLSTALAVTLPKAYTEIAGINGEDYVQVTMEEDGAITIRKHQFIVRKGKDDIYGFSTTTTT